MLVEHEGRLIPIEEPINLAERRPTPHPSQVIDLTNDDDCHGSFHYEISQI